jgi:hypothetical protein
MLSRKGGKLTVALFAKELNTVIIPAHAGKASALVNKNGVTSYTSHTVAWRYMVQLGLKYGALKKGLMQEHERKDVVKAPSFKTLEVNLLFLFSLPPPPLRPSIPSSLT